MACLSGPGSTNTNPQNPQHVPLGRWTCEKHGEGGMAAKNISNHSYVQTVMYTHKCIYIMLFCIPRQINTVARVTMVEGWIMRRLISRQFSIEYLCIAVNQQYMGRRQELGALVRVLLFEGSHCCPTAVVNAHHHVTAP